MPHIERRGSLYAVNFGVELKTDAVKASLPELGFCPGNTDSIFSFRANTDWQRFVPMVALDSSIRHGEKEMVAFVPSAGDPWRIVLMPKEKPAPWKSDVWFICKKVEPV